MISIFYFLENDKEEDIDECEYEDVDDEVKDEEDDAEEVGGDSDDESPLKQSETDQILKELNMTKSSGNFWEKVLSSHRSVTSVVHDAKKFSWILVTFNRDPSSENIDLVHIIESAVREISIQGCLIRKKIIKITSFFLAKFVIFRKFLFSSNLQHHFKHKNSDYLSESL